MLSGAEQPRELIGLEALEVIARTCVGRAAEKPRQRLDVLDLSARELNANVMIEKSATSLAAGASADFSI